jgi:hypothetical protein
MENNYIEKKWDSEEFGMANKFFTAWLFCLNSDQIEERMGMAAEWIENHKT